MEKNELYSKVFLWLTIGLMITFLTGYSLSMNEVMMYKTFSGGSYILIILLELAIAFFFSLRLGKMSKMTAIICYIIYSLLTGVTFSIIFVTFKMTSIISVFLVCAVIFAIFAVIGYTTKKDVSKLGNILFMGLIGIILTAIINIFVGSSMLEIIISILGVIIFIGYIVFDMKRVEYISSYNPEAGPIYGAFQLYLDFINLFIDLLRLIGDLKD